MKSLKGTKTEKNILAAFIGESQARNKYTFWASKAKKDGFVQIQKIFLETADQEKEHAERLFKFLDGGGEGIELTASGNAGMIGSTLENLKMAAAGENYEWQKMYPGFAEIADEEGFPIIATVMRNIAVAEKYHARRYETFIKRLEENTMWTEKEAITWRCSNCGFNYTSKEAPDECPACAHAKAYFERLVENW
ncbi:MAG: ferritin family protein [Treponemataceae bacterium]